MAGIVNAIGFGVLALSLVPLGKSFFPDPVQYTTTVRIHAGEVQSGEESFNTGGNVPGVGVFDGNGGRIGFMSGTRKGKIDQDNWHDVAVNPVNSHNNADAEYISVSGGGTDAICISHIEVTTAGGSQFQFYGDVPKTCGLAWYHSKDYVTLQQAYSYSPSCFWITSPNDNGKRSGMSADLPDGFPQGISFRILDFQSGNTNRAQQYVDHPETMCQSTPRFKAYQNLTEMNCVPYYDQPMAETSNFTDADFAALKTDGKVACAPGPNDPVTTQQKNQLEQITFGRAGANAPAYGAKARSEPVDINKRTGNSTCNNHQIVVSDYDLHSATELCNSATSIGPDFVSTKEDFFCDMCAHELWPLCSPTINQACFDMTSMTIKAGTGSLGSREVPTKKYKRTIQWRK